MNDSRYEQIISRISEHIRRTMEYCSGVSHDTFMSNSMIQEACIFNVLQTGELAAKAIEYGLDKEHPEIMWRQMRGMRNRIVHDYEGIRQEMVWDTINKDFPELLKLMNKDR